MFHNGSAIPDEEYRGPAPLYGAAQPGVITPLYADGVAPMVSSSVTQLPDVARFPPWSSLGRVYLHDDGNATGTKVKEQDIKDHQNEMEADNTPSLQTLALYSIASNLDKFGELSVDSLLWDPHGKAVFAMLCSVQRWHESTVVPTRTTRFVLALDGILLLQYYILTVIKKRLEKQATVTMDQLWAKHVSGAATSDAENMELFQYYRTVSAAVLRCNTYTTLDVEWTFQRLTKYQKLAFSLKELVLEVGDPSLCMDLCRSVCHLQMLERLRVVGYVLLQSMISDDMLCK
jgi:hypothetical protein